MWERVEHFFVREFFKTCWRNAAYVPSMNGTLMRSWEKSLNRKIIRRSSLLPRLAALTLFFRLEGFAGRISRTCRGYFRKFTNLVGRLRAKFADGWVPVELPKHYEEALEIHERFDW